MIIRGNILEYGEQVSIKFNGEDFSGLDDVLNHCFKYFNNIDELYIYELIINSKVLCRKNIEELWERMKLISVGNNYFFKGY